MEFNDNPGIGDLLGLDADDDMAGIGALLGNLLGGPPVHTTICADEAHFGGFHCHITHPTLGDVPVDEYDDTQRNIAALILEVADHQRKCVERAREAMAEQERTATAQSHSRIMARMRRQTDPADDTSVADAMAELDDIQVVFERLAVGFVLVKEGHDDGEFFDQLVVNLAVSDMLSRDVGSVIPAPPDDQSFIDDVGTPDEEVVDQSVSVN